MHELEPSPQCLAMIWSSTQRLAGDLGGLTDPQVREPTALPGWSRAHVLSHLAAQVSALQRLLEWATTGRRTPQYESRAARDAEIERGSRCSAAELVDRVAASAADLQDSFATLPYDAWNATIQPFTGEICTPRRILVIRVRELEVHHVDLGVGYTFADGSPEALEVVLSDVTSRLEATPAAPELEIRQTDGPFRYRRGSAGPTVSDTGAALVCWLTGRRGHPPPACTSPHLPALPPWL